MSDTVTTAREYYKDLLLYQWVNMPLARETIGALVDCALSDLVVLDVRDAFNLNTAVGDQLDIIGKYLGFSRRVLGQIPRNYFELVDYNTPTSTAPGLTDYTDTNLNTDGVFDNYIFAFNSFSDLGDDEYRFMLKLKLVLNSSDNTLATIQNILWKFLGYDLIAWDERDMTMSYTVLSNKSYFTKLAVSQALLPKPAGVTLSGVFNVTDQTKIFRLANYLEDNGAGGLSDYLTGFNGNQFISYQDKVS
jgi:hypothetical protein